jgi:hypothetical protein
MQEMDLNIHNYSITDLENFFKVKKNTYTEADIEEREYEIREQLLSSGQISKKFKRDLIAFLDEAKELLQQVVTKNLPPTAMAKNVRLDTSDVPPSEVLATSRMPLVIERPLTNYVNVQSSEYFQGVINPLSTRVIHKNITVDTRFRDRYYYTSSSDFMINMPSKLSKVVSMQLTALELPRAFYSISAAYGNNYFVMQVFEKIEGIGYESSRIIVVPDGNYTPQGLIDEINRILCPVYDNNIMQNLDDVFSYIQFDILSNHGSGSNKVRVEVNQSYPLFAKQIEEIVLNFGTDIEGNNDSRYLTTKIGWNLGFTNTLYNGCTSYISEKAIEPNMIKYIYLAVDDFNKSVNESFISAFEKNGLKPNILARISMHNNSDTIINKEYEIVAETRKYFGPVDIQRLHVYLFDDHGRILNMHSSDYSFCLHCQILYDL